MNKKNESSKKPTKKGVNSGMALAMRQGVHMKLGILLRSVLASWSEVSQALSRMPDDKRVEAIGGLTQDPVTAYPWSYPWAEGSVLDQIFDQKKKEVKASCVEMSVLRQAEREADRIMKAVKDVRFKAIPRTTKSNRGRK